MWTPIQWIKSLFLSWYIISEGGGGKFFIFARRNLREFRFIRDKFFCHFEYPPCTTYSLVRYALICIFLGHTQILEVLVLWLWSTFWYNYLYSRVYSILVLFFNQRSRYSKWILKCFLVTTREYFLECIWSIFEESSS